MAKQNDGKFYDIHLLGQPSVLVDGSPIVFPYKKVEGLFYYMCVEKRTLREAAISIFWADCNENTARKNLRDALYHIRRIVGEGVILPEGNSVLYLNPDLSINIDADKSGEALYSSYSGEFLKYFHIKNCLDFENWVDRQRESLEASYIDAVKEKAEGAFKEENSNVLVECSEKLLTLPYLDEAYYREVMSFLMDRNENSLATVLYRRLKDALRLALDEEPEEETVALYEKMLAMRKSLSKGVTTERDVFVGREAEVDTILDTFFRHKEDEGGNTPNYVLISGEAGVGKTALLERIKRELSGTDSILFSYTCIPSESGLYLKTWTDLLKRFLDYVGREKTLPETRNQPIPEDITDFRLFSTQYGIWMDDFLRAFMSAHPGQTMVIIIDDQQWMDVTSISFLNTFLSHLREYPFFVIGATRPDPPVELKTLVASLQRDAAVVTVNLSNFTKEEAKSVIATRSPALIKKRELVDDIYEYTEGNALFLTELLNSVNENGTEVIKEDPLTSRMVGVIQSRLMSLQKEELYLLELIAAFHRSVTIADLQLLYQQSDIRLYSVLEELLQHQIIVEIVQDDEILYNFSHGLIKNYVASEMSAGRRRLYAKHIAEHFESLYGSTDDVDHLSDLIYYFGEAQDTYKYYSYTIEYHKAFFSSAQEIYPATPSGKGERILLPTDDKESNIFVSLAEEIRALPQEDLQNSELRMKMEYLVGRFDLSSGNYEKGLRNMNTCIKNATTLGNATYLMDAYRQMIYYAIQIYDMDMMQEYLTLCDELLKKNSFSEQDIDINKRLRALYYIKIEKYKEAEKLLIDLIDTLDAQSSDISSMGTALIACYNYRCEIEMERGNWESALKFVDQAINYSEQLPIIAGGAVAYTNKGIILYEMGRYEEAEASFKQAEDYFTHVSIEWGKAKEEIYAAYVDVELSEPESAAEHYSQACKYVTKDYSPTTTSLLHDLYEKLKDIDGIQVEVPPETPKHA